MKGRIRRCPDDGTYTLRETCPACGKATATPHPAPFSPGDRYGSFRRIARGWTR